MLHYDAHMYEIIETRPGISAAIVMHDRVKFVPSPAQQPRIINLFGASMYNWASSYNVLQVTIKRLWVEVIFVSEEEAEKAYEDLNECWLDELEHKAELVNNTIIFSEEE